MVKAVSRGGRFSPGHQHCKALPLATACGGKGLTLLVTQQFAMRWTAACGFGDPVPRLYTAADFYGSWAASRCLMARRSRNLMCVPVPVPASC